jgi:hypothetical protein
MGPAIILLGRINQQKKRVAAVAVARFSVVG